jgi:hypothetical protein
MLKIALMGAVLLALISTAALADDAPSDQPPGTDLFDSCNAYYCHLKTDPPAVVSGVQYRPGAIVIGPGGHLENVCVIRAYTLGVGAQGAVLNNARPISQCATPN